ncbi:MAG: serine/threonine protein kinase [Bradymonadaceae bacterium]|nr:serine/threonine protein kinase [Lujinxingiaceae bacterium]
MAICPHCQTVSDFLAPCPTGDGFFCIEENEHVSHPDDRLLGQQIAGRFIVVSVIGHGSMGHVYKAIQGQVDRSVALKIFRPEYLSGTTGDQKGDDEARRQGQQRFVQEARVLGSLSHPNCVTLYDFGFSDHGDFLYIAMEYVGGISLRRAVRRGLKIRPIIEITKQILLALREAHALDIVHRDLKPENIMLSHRATTDEQIVKVLDFGIAKLLQQDTESQTMAGLLFGTPAYMSPEQCRGDVAAIGPATDIYALGCMMYEMICGQLPYDSHIPHEMVRLHLNAPIPALHGRSGATVPPAIEQFVKRCMSKEPSARYGSAKIALKAFEEAIETEGLGSGVRSRGHDANDTGSRKVVVPKNKISGIHIDPVTTPEAGVEALAMVVDERALAPADASVQAAQVMVDKVSIKQPRVAIAGSALGQQGVVDTMEGTAQAAGALDGERLSTIAGGSRGILLIMALLGVLVFCASLFYYIYTYVLG